MIFDESKPPTKPTEWIDPVKPGPAPIKLPAGTAATVSDVKPDGKAALEKYAARLRERYAHVEEIFKADPYNPLPSKDFKRFMIDQASEHAMRYIVTGHSEPLDEVVAGVIASAKSPDAKAEALKKQGFVVSGDAQATADVKAGEEVTKPKAAPEPELEQIGNLALMDTPVGRMAVELGFDMHGLDDDE